MIYLDWKCNFLRPKHYLMTPDQQKHLNPSGQPIVVQQVQTKSNGIGTAGFILAITAIFLGWIPFFGWLIWILGAIFSFVGVFKEPRGLSIAGLVISFIGIIFLILVFGVLLGTAALTS